MLGFTHRRKSAFWPVALGMASVMAVVTGCRVYRRAAMPVPAGPPRLVLDNEAVDLGQGAPGQVLVGAIALHNAGGEPLHVIEVRPGCVCAELGPAPTRIPPGETAKIRVSVTIRGDGQRLVFPVQIATNDPEQPTAACVVKATGPPPFLRCQPVSLDMGEIPSGSVTMGKTLVLSRRDGSKKPHTSKLEFTALHGAIEAKLLETGPSAAGQLVVQVRPRHDLPIGPFDDVLIIRRTDDDRTVQVPIRGRVVPHVLVSPTTLYFGGALSVGHARKRRFLVRFTDATGLGAMVKVETSLPVIVKEERRREQTAADHPRVFIVTLDQTQAYRAGLSGAVRLWFAAVREPVSVRVVISLANKTDERATVRP